MMNLGDIVKGFVKTVQCANDGYTATKIVDYYQMALRVHGIYRDDKLFEYLRRESRKMYSTIKEQKVRDFLLQNIDPKFLTRKK